MVVWEQERKLGNLEDILETVVLTELCKKILLWEVKYGSNETP